MPSGVKKLQYQFGSKVRRVRHCVGRGSLAFSWPTRSAARTGRIGAAVLITAGICVAEITSAPASMAAPGGLVAAYGFNEGSGTTVTDASGNGNNGTITNATWVTTGKYGDALKFNGTSALVTVPDAASLHLSAGMTLEAWVNPSTVNANWRDVIYKANDNFYLEATSTNGSVPDAGMIAGGSYADAFGTAALSVNAWSYLTETYDGSMLRLYVNGTQVASTAHTGAIATSTNPLQIGGDSLYGQNFAGLIDEVRVYNVALTAAQIQTDETTPVTSGPPSQPGTLTATAVSPGEVDLSWGASTGSVSGYLIERCQGASCSSFTQIAAPAGTGTTYKDTTVSASTSYSYRVRATDTAGDLSPYSNTATATTTTLGPATKLAFVQGPSNTAVGAAITPAVTVAVEDANGNVETSDNATQVSLAIGTNPAGGTLSGGSAVTVASGIATFSGLSINTAGTGYTLTASSTPSYTAATSAAFNITTTSSSWTTYMQGNDRTGFTSDSVFNPTSAQNLHLAWQASDTAPNHGVFPQPAVSNGLVYWGSNDGNERATNTSGNLVWQTNLGRTNTPKCTDPSNFGIASTPTITTDVPVGTATSVLYVGGGNSKVYALNAATGAVLWSYDVGGNPNTFIWDSPLVYGNSVYIGVSSFGDCPLTAGQLLQLNRVTGTLQNTLNLVPNGCTGAGVWGSPTLDSAAGTIYFATGNPPDTGSCSTSEPLGSALVEVRASDLSVVGSFAIPPAQQGGDSDFGSTPTLFNGVIGGQSEPLVGVINKNGIYYAFKRDALSSGPVWETSVAIGGGNPTSGNGPIAPAAFDGTRLYVGADNTTGCSGTVNALNPSTGAFIWQHCFTDGGFVDGAVTVTSGGVVAVGEGSNIVVVSAATGASLFTYAAAGLIWGASSIVGSTLYQGDMAGNLYALTTG
jgi:outer membrane protein assembly factor BamB